MLAISKMLKSNLQRDVAEYEKHFIFALVLFFFSSGIIDEPHPMAKFNLPLHNNIAWPSAIRLYLIAYGKYNFVHWPLSGENLGDDATNVIETDRDAREQSDTIIAIN